MLTINSWLSGIGYFSKRECPLWPPDLFAIAGALLRRSGAYLRIFDDERPKKTFADISELAESWRSKIDALRHINRSGLRKARPSAVVELWKAILAKGETSIAHIRDSVRLTDQLIRLTLVADEASAGIGVNCADHNVEPSGTFLSLAQAVLVNSGNRSFCVDVPPDLVCVLGKQHTPQRGATFRSLTHHLALLFRAISRPDGRVPIPSQPIPAKGTSP